MHPMAQRILLGILALGFCGWGGALPAQEPVVLIDASQLPTPDSNILDPTVVERKLAAGAESAGTETAGTETTALPKAHPPLGSIAKHSVAGATGEKALPVCLRTDVFATSGLLFADSFESGTIDAWGLEQTVYSADGSVDLRFDVVFDGTFVGDHVLHLELTTPRGHHYQTVSVPIASQTSLAGSQRALEGYPFPVDVQVTQPAGVTGSRASVRLPVAGTAIVTHGLYGTWTARAFVDQLAEPCGETERFRLVP